MIGKSEQLEPAERRNINQSVERTQYIDNSADMIEMFQLKDEVSQEEIVRNQIFETPKSARSPKV